LSQNQSKRKRKISIPGTLHLFYTSDITVPDYVLNREESRHAVKVLRLIAGEFIYLVDGKGGFYKAEIRQSDDEHCRVRIIETQQEYKKQFFHLHIAIAPTKSTDRIEWFLEKATEIGIHEITLLECFRSERRAVKPERLNKVLISAMKQSLKAYLPLLNEKTDFKTLLQNKYHGEKFIAHCNPSDSKLHLKNCYTSGKNAFLLIGPEGDFSPEEVELAIQNGFREISLGNSRLRTETAGLVACSIINMLNS
jgi:16S rRNA (uracil1498-N3)-methyltransferase